MGRITICRKFQFCAGHRVLNHESKCRNPHGHNYEAWVWVTCDKLDALDRVIDFSAVKNLIGNWIDSAWDHGFLLNGADTDLLMLFHAESGFKWFAFPNNPTAEVMAEYLFYKSREILAFIPGLQVTKVRVWETPNCFADYKE